MNRIFKILGVILIVFQSLHGQTDKVIYHSCYQTASAFKLTDWNIENSADRFALKETIDRYGRVKKLEFLINQKGSTLCYLPSIVEYEYKPNQIIETLFSSPDEILLASECEMNFKTIYHLEDSIITNVEYFFEFDSSNYSKEELIELKRYYRPYVQHKPDKSSNTEVEYYLFSFAKYDGFYPTNLGYQFLEGNYYYDVWPVNEHIKKALSARVKRVQKEYPFETKLQNGYNLKYEIIEDSESRIQQISLVHNDKMIKTLNDISLGLPFKNLGYIGVDFDNSFVFIQSYGSGNPHNFQLIEKASGKLVKEGFYLESHKLQEVVLYMIEQEDQEVFKLYDVKTNKEFDILEFDLSICDNSLDCISIDEVTDDLIILKQEVNSQVLTKKYYR